MTTVAITKINYFKASISARMMTTSVTRRQITKKIFFCGVTNCKSHQKEVKIIIRRN